MDLFSRYSVKTMFSRYKPSTGLIRELVMTTSSDSRMGLSAFCRLTDVHRASPTATLTSAKLIALVRLRSMRCGKTLWATAHTGLRSLYLTDANEPVHCTIQRAGCF